MAIKARRGKLYPAISLEEGIELGLDEIEWDRIVTRLGRNPNHFESSIFASLWSDRVSFKNSSALIESANFEYSNLQNLPGSTLKLLDIDEDLQIALRISQSNSLCSIEPFFAAQSALDSSLQELTAAGAKPIAILTMGRFGNPEQLSHQRKFKKLIGGLAHFSNKTGVPMLDGDYYFHKSYNKSPMINSAVIGIVETKKQTRTTPLPFTSPILYVGALTGPDEIPSQGKMPKAIPMGDPLLSRRLLSAAREALQAGLAEEIIVLGSGGLGVGAFNMAQRSLRPILIDIDRIPTRGSIKEPLDILRSESADRILITTTPEKHRDLNKILYKWDLSSTRIGEVNDSDGIEFYWNHYQAADIPFQFAVTGASKKTMEVVQFPPMLKRSDRNTNSAALKRHKKIQKDDWSLIREVSIKSELTQTEKNIPCPSNLEDVWLDMLANPNLSSRTPVFSMFDQLVGGRTLHYNSGDSTILRLELKKKENKHQRAIATTLVSNSLYVSTEPYLGTVQTVAEAMRNLACVGAKPLALASCLNFGSSERYREVCDLAEAIRGLGDASRIWELPIMSEEVSLENGTEGSPTMPTPVIIALGLINDPSKICPQSFQEKGDRIFLLGESKNEIGCSEYSLYIHKRVNTLVPDINFESEKNRCLQIIDLIDQGILSSCHDLGRGGLSLSLVESCLLRKRPIGAKINITQNFVPSESGAALRPDSALFGESSSRFLVSCRPDKEEELISFCEKHRIPIGGSGEVGGKTISISGLADIDLPLSTTYKLWVHRLESYLHPDLKESSTTMDARA